MGTRSVFVQVQLLLALVFAFPVGLQAQCEDLVITDVSTWWECRGNGAAGYQVVQVNHVSWSGGTPPFTGDHSVGGLFGSTGGFALWESNVATVDGSSLVLVPSASIVDANGCEAFATGPGGIQYWVDPTDQVIVSSSIWDPGSGTATVTFVDNPSDPGVSLPHDPSVIYWLNCVTDPGNGRTGQVSEVYATTPARYVFSGLPPGTYELWLMNDGQPTSSGVPCEGLANSFIVEQGPPGLVVVPRVLLGGAMPTTGGLMNDALRTNGTLPEQEPYTALGYAFVGTHGAMVLSSSVLAQSGNDAIVDWVVVELRQGNQPGTVLASRPALLQRDGDVVAPNGAALSFNMPAGSYHVAVRHRNHLPVATGVTWGLSGVPTTIDLTSTTTLTYGTNARTLINERLCLWPGDQNFDGMIRYVGVGNDRDPILQAIGGSTPTNVVSGVYSLRDVNMDGSIRYVGAGNDRDPILQTVGGSVPTAVRSQQLP